MKNYQKIIILVFLLPGMVAISACLGNESSATGMYSAPTISTTTPPITNQPVVIIKEQLNYTSTGDAYVSGIVKSNMNRPLIAFLNVELKDKSNVTLGSAETIVKLDVRGVSNFNASIPDSGTYAHNEGITYRCYINRVDY
jgi:hypothetical protein